MPRYSFGALAWWRMLSRKNINFKKSYMNSKLIDSIAIQPVPDDYQKKINIVKITRCDGSTIYTADFYYYFLFEKKSIANKFKKELISARLCNGSHYAGVSRKLNLVTLHCYLNEYNHYPANHWKEARETVNDLKIKIKNRSEKLFAIYTKYQSDIVKVIFTQTHDLI